jgi:hypothetical protein
MGRLLMETLLLAVDEFGSIGITHDFTAINSLSYQYQ